MGLISEVMSLLKRPIEPLPIALDAPGRPKVATPADQVPITESEIITGLERASAERAVAERTVETAAAKRDALLLVEGSDRDIAKLGVELDAASLLLERLDRLEQELRGRLVEVRKAFTQDAFTDLAVEYQAAVRVFAEKFDAAIAARESLIAIRQRADGLGLPPHRLELPRAALPLTHEALAVFKMSALTSADPAATIAAQRLAYPLVITGTTYGQFNVGETIGLTAEEGWRWVSLGMARWADPTNTPPRPPEGIKPKKPSNQDRLDRAFAAKTGGRA
jgi:hypothetical protein